MKQHEEENSKCLQEQLVQELAKLKVNLESMEFPMLSPMAQAEKEDEIAALEQRYARNQHRKVFQPYNTNVKYHDLHITG